MIKTTLFIIVTLLAIEVAAQQIEKNNNKIRFGANVNGGIVVGRNGESELLQASLGIRKNKWFTAIGTGLDFYNDRTQPLFIDVRRDLLSKKITPFLYLNGGVNYTLLNFIEREERHMPTELPGGYYDVGIGWRFGKYQQRSGFTLSAGYSMKQEREKGTATIYNPAMQQIESSDFYNDYRFHRFIFKAGFQF